MKNQSVVIKEKKRKKMKMEIELNFIILGAFLKISASPLAAHCQAALADPETKACQRTVILLPTRPIFSL